jgi:hypothetical protein
VRIGCDPDVAFNLVPIPVMAPSCLSTFGSLRGYSFLTDVSYCDWRIISVKLS